MLVAPSSSSMSWWLEGGGERMTFMLQVAISIYSWVSVSGADEDEDDDDDDRVYNHC